MRQLAFYLCAAVLLAGAGSAALRADLRRAARALVLSGAGLAGLLALLGATTAAAVQAVLAAGGALMLRRAATLESRREQSPDGTADGGDAANTDAQVPPSPGDAAEPLPAWRAAILVVAFLAIVLRALLMASWPLLADAPAQSSAASLSHHLVVAAVLFCIGLFTATARRSRVSPWIAVALMNSAAALGFAAAARRVEGASGGEMLAAVVILVAGAAAAWPMANALRGRETRLLPETMQQIGTDLAVATAGVTLALLASGW